MDFGQIAEFLNIPESTARRLAENDILPGHESLDGWDTSFRDLEEWYVRLTGRAWADLVANGHVDPLRVEIQLTKSHQSSRLVELLRSWESQGVIELFSCRVRDLENLTATLRLLEALVRAEECQASLEAHGVRSPVRESIEVSFRCEMMLSEQRLGLTFSEGHSLVLVAHDDLADKIQRDREIVRAYLANYATKLAAQLERA